VALHATCFAANFQRKLLEDEAILSDHNIKDDAVLYLQLQIGA
jgi:hypothetical protein